MRVASVCSGIGGAELAFAGLAQHAFAAEIDRFARAVFQHRFPGVTLHGDFTKIRPSGPVDVLVGGTPCQSFSIAGLRRGLADERGNLALEFLRLAERCGARWILWENVPGVLSSSGGRDFGAFLGGLVELGYGFAYRVLDAQFFGLAQRRKRVFVVGYLGDWRRAAAVLFEPACLRGDSAPRREAREGVAGTLAAGAHPSGFNGRDAERGNVIAHSLRTQGQSSHRADSETFVTGTLTGNGDAHSGFKDEHGLVAGTLNSSIGRGTGGAHETDFISVAHSLRADGFDASEDGTGRGTPLVAFDINQTANPHHRPRLEEGGPCGTLNVYNNFGIAGSSAVRRLTPRECERLQGFPDDWTAVTYRNKPAADGPRYRALGNAFAVPVVRWIAKRIAREHTSFRAQEIAA